MYALLSDISHVTDTCESQVSDPRTLVCVVFVVWVEAAPTKPFGSPFEHPMVISYLFWTPVQSPAGYRSKGAASVHVAV